MHANGKLCTVSDIGVKLSLIDDWWRAYLEEISGRTFPKQVLRYPALEEADVLKTNPARGDQQRYTDGNRQRDGEGETEALYADLAGKLRRNVAEMGGADLNQGDN